MISTRILDNDMGAVLKSPLTSRGTVHGLTVEIDKVKLPEFDVGILEILATDMSMPRFTEHAGEHLQNSELAARFIAEYKAYVTPINKSPRRY